jgi:hypothetical protein
VDQTARCVGEGHRDRRVPSVGGSLGNIDKFPIDLGDGRVRTQSVLEHSHYLMETVAGVAITTSPAMMAYVTTETGVVTMIIMVLVAGYLLTHTPPRSATCASCACIPDP